MSELGTVVTFPKPGNFPKIMKLGIDMSSEHLNEQNVVRSSTIKLETIISIVELFPTLKKIQCVSLPVNLVEYFLSRNSTTSIIHSITLRLRTWESYPRTILSLANPSNCLTRIEFLIEIGNRSLNYDIILATFAAKLENLKVSGIDLTWPRFREFNPPKDITFPEVLPKLRCLEFGISKYFFGCEEEAPKFPTFELKFSGGNLIYSRQFPALEKLVVSKFPELESYYSSSENISEREWFKICVEFLNKYFLLVGDECPTVREVRVPLPQGKMVGFIIFTEFPDKNYDNVGISEYCMVDCSKFFSRLLTTFPNLNPRWAMFEKVDPHDVMEWVRVGKEMDG